MCFRAQSLYLELRLAARLVQFFFSVQPMQMLILEGRLLLLEGRFFEGFLFLT
jgi:hypothetical protein